MDRLIIYVTLDNRVVQKKPVDKDIFSIGREGDNDIHINNLAISRHHAEISIDGGKFFIKDLDSANGTFLNGVKINYAELYPGDVVSIGKYALKIESREPVRDIAYGESNTVVVDQYTQDKFLKQLDSVKHDDLNETSRSRLLISNKSEVMINDDYFTIGKDTSANLRIKGFFVKGKHATIIKRKDGNHSLISSGTYFCPTKVNGMKVDETTLTTGDIIQIGRNKMIYVR